MTLLGLRQHCKQIKTFIKSIFKIPSQCYIENMTPVPCENVIVLSFLYC